MGQPPLSASEEALQKGVLGALCARSLFWLHLFHVLR